MTERPIAERNLTGEMHVGDAEIERRKKIVGFTDADLERIAGLRDLVVSRAGELAGSFFEFLAGLEEARGLLGNRDLLEKARRLKVEHLTAMAQGKYDQAYAEQRL